MGSSFNFINNVSNEDDLYKCGQLFNELDKIPIDVQKIGHDINVNIAKKIYELEKYIVAKCLEPEDEECIEINYVIKMGRSMILTWDSDKYVNNMSELRPISKNYVEFRDTYNKYINKGGNCNEVWV